MPIAITRTYRSEARDTGGHFISSDFGLGTTLNYGIFLYSYSEVASGTYNDAELVLPDGSENKCQNPILNQTDYTQANFVCKYQPIGIWFGATLKWNATTLQWNLTRKDGTVYSFGKGAPLQKIADRYSNSVTVSRHASSLSGCTNPGTRIESFIAGVSTGRYVNICYDSSQDSNRVTKVVDNSSREVDYTYLLDNVTSESAPEGAATYQYNWILPRTLQVPNQSIVNYTFDPASRPTNVAQGSLAASSLYDAADRPTCLTLPNNVIVTYGYDSDSRVTSLTYGTGGSCTSPPNNLGTLTYTYDADNRIVGTGGSLAAVNLPGVLSSATYRATNQVLTWNGVSSTIDAANNLKTDPSNGSVPYGWDERNQLSSASNPNYLFYYDAFGRRETFDDFGLIMSYLYDDLMAVQETSSNTQTIPTRIT
jgi:YD repeat-containing protein